jgi:hypothetical protein
MRHLETDPSKLPPWARDISNALASAKEAPPEQRLVMFLAALSAEMLRLAGAESDEAGEVVAYATICLRGLFSDPGVTPSDEELDRWTPRVHVMLILESLQRRGYVYVNYGDSALDPLAADAPIRLISTWAEAPRSLGQWLGRPLVMGVGHGRQRKGIVSSLAFRWRNTITKKKILALSQPPTQQTCQPSICLPTATGPDKRRNLVSSSIGSHLSLRLRLTVKRRKRATGSTAGRGAEV